MGQGPEHGQWCDCHIVLFLGTCGLCTVARTLAALLLPKVGGQPTHTALCNPLACHPTLHHRRLQASRTTKYVRCFLVFLSTFIAKLGPQAAQVRAMPCAACDVHMVMPALVAFCLHTLPVLRCGTLHNA